MESTKRIESEIYAMEEEIINKDDVKIYTEDNPITCPICLCIIINPMICFNCQNSFCKDCIENWLKTNNSCPNRCQNPQLAVDRRLAKVLSKLKFRCRNGCNIEIPYEKLKEHYTNDCANIPKDQIILSLKNQLNQVQKEKNDLNIKVGELQKQLGELKLNSAVRNRASYSNEVEIVKVYLGFGNNIENDIVRIVKEGINLYGDDYMKSTQYIGTYLEQNYLEYLWSVNIFEEGCGNSFVYYNNTPNIKLRYKGKFIKIYTHEKNINYYNN